MLKAGITISTSSDSDDITDEMSTYWFGANVYVCEFPVVRSITLKTRVLGYKFSRYTSPVEDEGVELDGVDVCVLVDEDEEGLELCELVDDGGGVELEDVDPPCSICCGVVG